MTIRQRPTVGDFALGTIGAVAAFLFIALVIVVPRMTGESERRAAKPEAPPVLEVPFTVELMADGRGVRLAGRISHGMTERLESLLRGGAPINRLELNSPGGLVAEARGLVRLIDTYGLSTFVAADCLSACTLVFASGTTRHLAPGARLGFHSYRLSAPALSLLMDVPAEQDKDMDILRRRDVPQAFIARIDATAPGTMWFPSHRELLDARMVDAIGDPR